MWFWESLGTKLWFYFSWPCYYHEEFWGKCLYSPRSRGIQKMVNFKTWASYDCCERKNLIIGISTYGKISGICRRSCDHNDFIDILLPVFQRESMERSETRLYDVLGFRMLWFIFNLNFRKRYNYIFIVYQILVILYFRMLRHLMRNFGSTSYIVQSSLRTGKHYSKDDYSSFPY